MKIAFAAILALSASAFPAFASNGDCEFPAETRSVIYLGDPCDLIEPEVVEAEEIAKADPNGALVNANGMPTSMPVVMRPSMDSEPVPAEAAPAAASAPADTAKPKGDETKPAPVAEADKPKEPEQQASAPAPEQPLPPVAPQQEGEELN